jgi:molybdopterin molybdotransferase
MISITEAENIIKNSSITVETESIELINSVGHYLSEPIFSPLNMPPFSQSAMDGYAICGKGNSYTVVGEIKAGATHTHVLKNGEAYRVFTGAMIPENTTSIAKQEIVERLNDSITLTETVKVGTSIRKAGEELQKEDLVLGKGTQLNAAAIGLLSGLGIQNVTVYKKPKITLVITGDELTKQGQELQKGKIYESNSFTLKSALLNLGLESKTQFVKDDYFATKDTINSAIQSSDLVIMTGGISVGDYDFVGEALNELDVEQKFYKINQKPGKPLYYGEKDNTKIFALPGNPAAALTCFYVYVLTAIKTMMGASNPNLIKTKVTLSHNHTKKGDRGHLLKAKLINGEVAVHKGQSSAMLSSFVDANCLLHIDSTTNQIKKGSLVDVYLIP